MENIVIRKITCDEVESAMVQFNVDSSLTWWGRLAYNGGASPGGVVLGSLHRALVGGDARGFAYALMGWT